MARERHLHIAATLGFCNGVRRALEVVEKHLASGDVPLYVLHEIVHNNFIVSGLKERGVRFGAERKPRPENFEEVYARWHAGEISARHAAAMTRVAHTTFLKWARERQNAEICAS